MQDDRLHSLLKGSIGMLGSAGGVITSCIPQIEAGLRILSLVLGCTIGVLTLRSMLRKKP